ncbi:MAG: hypothetical protein ACP5JV_08975 [Thermus sp.]|uniref:hypothetical protein n=1 Tax=Thermus sp. TaxID=275 RepID=UPI003D098848
MKSLPETPPRLLPPIGVKDLEAAYLQGLLPPKAKEAYERMAWALDVEVEDLPAVLARLGLPERGWILTIGLVGWRPGTMPPGAEVLAREGLVDLASRRLTKKGRVVHDALEAVVLAVAKLKRGRKPRLPIR